MVVLRETKINEVTISTIFVENWYSHLEDLWDKLECLPETQHLKKQHDENTQITNALFALLGINTKSYYETLVTCGSLDKFKKRSNSITEALTTHEKTVRKVTDELNDNTHAFG